MFTPQMRFNTPDSFFLIQKKQNKKTFTSVSWRLCLLIRNRLKMDVQFTCCSSSLTTVKAADSVQTSHTADQSNKTRS